MLQPVQKNLEPVRKLLEKLVRWARRTELGVWHHSAFRLPIPSVEGLTGIEPRRADFAVAYLLDSGAVSRSRVFEPERISYRDLARVHATELLESLSQPKELARIFAVDESDVPVDEVWHTIRLACGATLEAARWTLATHKPSLNLLGGFHHAGPRIAGGFCPVNDIAVAIAALRSEGFRGQVVILDLDAHPPDGTDACIASLDKVWLGSLSGADWGPLPASDETVLAAGTGDEGYLRALQQLLGRAPRAKLAFVIAGGDVLETDRLGGLSLSMAGARQRDLIVRRHLGTRPAVWLPGGGYSQDAWRALAGTGLALSLRTTSPVSASYNALRYDYSRIAASLSREQLEGLEGLTIEDVLGDLGVSDARNRRFLGFYTASGIELALERYGILAQVRRFGYKYFRVDIESASGVGDRLRVFGKAGGSEHLLVELAAEQDKALDMLYVNWLTLRNPRGLFSEQRPPLPGQECPGLGLARESGELLLRMAQRLGLRGVAFRPASYHLAFTARHDCRFEDTARQGRFEALQRDLKGVPLRRASRALADGRVTLNGKPYSWEADLMVHWVTPPEDESDQVSGARERAHFKIVEEPKD